MLDWRKTHNKTEQSEDITKHAGLMSLWSKIIDRLYY